MALKNVCLVPRGWTIAECRRHTCSDHSHSHISAAQLRKYETLGTVRVIARAGASCERTIAVRAASYRCAVAPSVRDQSCRVGEELALALALRLLWARVMLSDIRHRGVKEEEAA